MYEDEIKQSAQMCAQIIINRLNGLITFDEKYLYSYIIEAIENSKSINQQHEPPL